MSAQRVAIVGGAVALLAAAVAVLWPRGPEIGPCLQAADAAAVEGWRGVRVAAPLQGAPGGTRLCRTTWRDARSADRTLLIVTVHRNEGGADGVRRRGEVETLRRGEVDVRVLRPIPGRAVVVVPLDAEVWAEVTVEDEQQGDTTYWADRVLARRSAILTQHVRNGQH